MSTTEETTATTVRALTDALNARDRQATVALFASDGIFRPGAAGANFQGPEAIADALFGFLGVHKSGEFETLHEVFAGNEAYHEWKWVGVTNEGEPTETHGCDYYLIRNGKWQSGAHFGRPDEDAIGSNGIVEDGYLAADGYKRN